MALTQVPPTLLTQPLTAGTAVASTSGTNIDFTNIPAWVKRITVMFNGVSTNGTSIWQIQVGAGSVTTSGYGGSACYNSGGSVSQGVFSTGLGIANLSVAAATYSGTATFTLLGSNIWTATSCLSAYGSGSALLTASCVIALSGTLDRVRITTVNGTDTFDAGSINILYE